ncbi:MAG: GTP cyclohydrolase I, partial [Treponema sp.]|nr:GTP cyclohydrolase I [Treponema sp.]
MINEEKVKQAVALFLEGIGENPEREGLKETPERVVRACKEIFGGYDGEPQKILSKVFASGNSELVIQKDIPFYSMCEHHLL